MSCCDSRKNNKDSTWKDKKVYKGKVEVEKRSHKVDEYRYKQPVTVVYQWGHKVKSRGNWEKDCDTKDYKKKVKSYKGCSSCQKNRGCSSCQKY